MPCERIGDCENPSQRKSGLLRFRADDDLIVRDGVVMIAVMGRGCTTENPCDSPTATTKRTKMRQQAAVEILKRFTMIVWLFACREDLGPRRLVSGETRSVSEQCGG